MIAFNPFLTVCWNSNLLVQMLWNLSNDDTVNCCWTVFLVSRQRVLTLPRYISYCKFIYMLALFLLQMSTCVGLVSAANVYMCWSGSFCKCLYVLLLFLLQIAIQLVFTCLSVPALNVSTRRSCSYFKCLRLLFLFLLQMSTHVGPVPTTNVYTCWSCSYCTANVLILHLKIKIIKILLNSTPSAWCSIGYVLDFIIGIF